MIQLFLDLDGVLADFYGYYTKCFGGTLEQDDNSSPAWNKIRDHGNFFRTEPLMPDAMDLWWGSRKLYPKPIILTGIPYSIPNVKEQKTEWVWENFGYDVKVICCRSQDKYKHGKPGDILVDDRRKYENYWTKMGGIFIHHTSAHWSLIALGGLYGRAGGSTSLPSTAY